MILSFQEVLVLIFVVLVAVWLFSRPREAADRWFLAIAGLVYIGVMVASYLLTAKPGRSEPTPEVLFILDTTGLLLVVLSRKLLKVSRRQKSTGPPR